LQGEADYKELNLTGKSNVEIGKIPLATSAFQVAEIHYPVLYRYKGGGYYLVPQKTGCIAPVSTTDK